MTARIKVGVTGTGAVARIMHLPYLRELDDHFEVTAIGDISPAALEAVGDHFHIDRRFTDYRELLATGADAVLVLAGGSHTPMVLDALAAKKHVFVEKPLSYTLREAGEIVAAAEASDRVAMAGYRLREIALAWRG